jgi:hypothetical protein
VDGEDVVLDGGPCHGEPYMVSRGRADFELTGPDINQAEVDPGLTLARTWKTLYCRYRDSGKRDADGRRVFAYAGSRVVKSVSPL